MIQIGDTILSFDIFECKFLCDLANCKGACCVEGDSGAPLTNEEAIEVELYYPVFQKYLSPQYKDEIEKSGTSLVDHDGELVTPLHNQLECLFSYIDEKGCTKCAIEKAWLSGEIPFRKPVSCHLFPIRITEYDDFEAVNYQQLEICKAGRKCGKKNNLPLYQFLKEPLIRKYGGEWYNQLEIAAEYVLNRDQGVF
jgi:hypothetical protein